MGTYGGKQNRLGPCLRLTSSLVRKTYTNTTMKRDECFALRTLSYPRDIVWEVNEDIPQQKNQTNQQMNKKNPKQTQKTKKKNPLWPEND